MAAECCSSCEYQRTVGYPSTSWASCFNTNHATKSVLFLGRPVDDSHIFLYKNQTGTNRAASSVVVRMQFESGSYRQTTTTHLGTTVALWEDLHSLNLVTTINNHPAALQVVLKTIKSSNIATKIEFNL